MGTIHAPKRPAPNHTRWIQRPHWSIGPPHRRVDRRQTSPSRQNTTPWPTAHETSPSCCYNSSQLVAAAPDTGPPIPSTVQLAPYAYNSNACHVALQSVRSARYPTHHTQPSARQYGARAWPPWATVRQGHLALAIAARIDDAADTIWSMPYTYPTQRSAPRVRHQVRREPNAHGSSRSVSRHTAAHASFTRDVNESACLVLALPRLRTLERLIGRHPMSPFPPASRRSGGSAVRHGCDYSTRTKHPPNRTTAAGVRRSLLPATAARTQPTPRTSWHRQHLHRSQRRRRRCAWCARTRPSCVRTCARARRAASSCRSRVCRAARYVVRPWSALSGYSPDKQRARLHT